MLVIRFEFYFNNLNINKHQEIEKLVGTACDCNGNFGSFYGRNIG